MTIAKISFVLVVLIFWSPAYQQIFNNSEICSTATFSVKTVFDFWHESTQDCEFDAHNLIKIHKKISINSDKQKNDQISDLLDGHVRSALMQNLFKQLLALISTKSLNTQPDMGRVFNDLYNEQDKSFLLDIWQKVLDESFLFIDAEDILQQLLSLTNDELKVHLLEYLLKKYENSDKKNYKFLPLLTFGVGSVIKQRMQTQNPIADPSIGSLVGKLPEQLLIIFQSWHYNVSVLNTNSNEYIFPERNNGASADKRFLFSFLPGRNKFRVKGKFKMQINSSGLITLGAPYGNSYSYLSAEKGRAFICLDCALNTAQWWQILWPHHESSHVDQQFVLFQNVATKELLCSSNTFKEDLILIATSEIHNHINDTHCHWKVVKRNK